MVRVLKRPAEQHFYLFEPRSVSDFGLILRNVWSPSNCQTSKFYNVSGDLIIRCTCDSLYPTTIVYDYLYLFLSPPSVIPFVVPAAVMIF